MNGFCSFGPYAQMCRCSQRNKTRVKAKNRTFKVKVEAKDLAQRPSVDVSEFGWTEGKHTTVL